MMVNIFKYAEFIPESVITKKNQTLDYLVKRISFLLYHLEHFSKALERNNRAIKRKKKDKNKLRVLKESMRIQGTRFEIINQAVKVLASYEKFVMKNTDKMEEVKPAFDEWNKQLAIVKSKTQSDLNELSKMFKPKVQQPVIEEENGKSI